VAAIQRVMPRNVIWERPSRDYSGSMPIGNGEIGLNVWVEEGGDLLFYIGTTDAWSENCRLLKLGRVRVELSPSPFAKGSPFRQVLNLHKGQIEIAAGEAERAVLLRVWVDANQPVVRVEADGKEAFDIRVQFETWRTHRRELKGREQHSVDQYAHSRGTNPHPYFVEPDVIVVAGKDRLVWYHRNERSIWADNLKLQALGHLTRTMSDPLLGRTFGGCIKGEGLIAADAQTLDSAGPRKRRLVSVYLLTAQTETADGWLELLDERVEAVDAVDLESSREAHHRWWDEFWNRSWIRVSGTEHGGLVTQGYTLQRWINACGGRGAHPIKFNGSIFNVDSEDEGQWDADYRVFGGPYWFSLTRLIYWPMLAAGDFDLMQSVFHMHLKTLPLAKERTRVYYGHDGAFFPVTVFFWGAYVSCDYGWEREGQPDGLAENPAVRYNWQDNLELLAIMADYYAYTGDTGFLKEKLLPMANEIITFYDQHYKRDENGKLYIWPAQVLEACKDCANPMPEIAGLKCVLAKLLSLPEEHTGEERRRQWQRLLSEVPALPTREVDGRTILAPAEKTFTEVINNGEKGELFAIFPYRLFGVGKPDLEFALESFRRRQQSPVRPGGFFHDLVFAAYLGLAPEAAECVVLYSKAKDGDSRFPAFWGPRQGYWIVHDTGPCQPHGGNLLNALQTMLLQAEGAKMILFPAWPKEWDVEFKLHAPMNTTVEGVYREGKLQQLEVTPASRKKDLVKMTPQ